MDLMLGSPNQYMTTNKKKRLNESVRCLTPNDSRTVKRFIESRGYTAISWKLKTRNSAYCYMVYSDMPEIEIIKEFFIQADIDKFMLILLNHAFSESMGIVYDNSLWVKKLSALIDTLNLIYNKES